MTDPSLALIVSDPEWSCATWRDVFVLVWRGPATASRARICVDELERFAAARPGGFAILIVLEASAPPPTDEARPIFAGGMRALSHTIRGSAYFMPIDGFRGSFLRSVVTGLSLLARETYPTRVFAGLPDGIRWLGEQLYPGESKVAKLAGLEEVVAKLRST